MNVQRYASYPQNVKAGDLTRCENTLKTLRNAEKELELLTGQVERKRAALFDSESQMVKLHCALELKKYDAKPFFPEDLSEGSDLFHQPNISYTGSAQS